MDQEAKSSAPVAVRPARPEEREALEALQRRASLVSEAYRALLLANPDAIALPAGRIEAGDVWLAEAAEGIAGFCVVTTLPGGHEAELDGLFVEPAHWRRGIGGVLVEKAAAVARARGARWLVVVSGRSEETFYALHGFAVTGEVETRFDTALAMRRAI